MMLVESPLDGRNDWRANPDHGSSPCLLPTQRVRNRTRLGGVPHRLPRYLLSAIGLWRLLIAQIPQVSNVAVVPQPVGVLCSLGGIGTLPTAAISPAMLPGQSRALMRCGPSTLAARAEAESGSGNDSDEPKRLFRTRR